MAGLIEAERPALEIFKVVVEGIESDTQVERLRELGFSTGQGFHFSRPVESSVFEQQLRQSIDATPTPASHVLGAC